jgi:hypothetical protein
MHCPAGALLDTWTQHDWSEGLQLDGLQELESLAVRTQNSTYEITVLSSETGEVLVRGGRFFPVFTPARLAGASLSGSVLKLRGIYVGFSMEIHSDTGPVVTSQVQSIGLVVGSQTH